jgi:hypothetical protein
VACKMMMTLPLTDDVEMQKALQGLIEAYFG